MEIMTDRDKDLFYSAVMLNTKINYKTIKEVQDLQLISNYRDISDKDIFSLPSLFLQRSIIRLLILSE